MEGEGLLLKYSVFGYFGLSNNFMGIFSDRNKVYSCHMCLVLIEIGCATTYLLGTSYNQCLQNDFGVAWGKKTDDVYRVMSVILDTMLVWM